MAKNDVQVNFRMPQELREKLQGSAESNNRTITSEIVARLQSSFEIAEKFSGFQEEMEALSSIAETIQKMDKAIERRDHVIQALGAQVALLAELSALGQPRHEGVLAEMSSIGEAYRDLDFSTGHDLVAAFHERYSPVVQAAQEMEKTRAKQKRKKKA